MDLRTTAYHEAGHAVASFYEGVRLRRVSVIPDKKDNTAGHVKHHRCGGPSLAWDTSARNRTRMEKSVLIALSGPAAQRRYSPRSVRHYHGYRDYQNAVGSILHFTGTDEEMGAYLHLMEIRAKQMINRPGFWPCVEALANELLVRKEIKGAEAWDIISAAIQRCEEKPRPRREGANLQILPKVVKESIQRIEGLVTPSGAVVPAKPGKGGKG